MKRKVFRKTLFFIFLIFVFSPLHSLPLDNIKEYTLENGLTVFLLQDTSTPLIRIEYTARAGFSNQTKGTSGFFKLYTRIFENICNSQGAQLEDALCNADSSRYIITTVPSQLSNILSVLSQTAFGMNYSDQILSAELSQLKKETAEEASSAGGFINAAIDSRVFSAYPWKHDSGVYPSLFNKTTTAKARTVLNSISYNWYTPQNSALFISGNINEETILFLIQDLFGQYYSAAKTPVSKKSLPINQKRKFVIHSSDFSQDMTQVVMQYTVLDMEEAELAATLLNNDNSSLKYQLVSLDKLAIPGNEYINAAAAHKKDSSRLIIQSLLQKPEGKQNEKITSDTQAQLFIQTVQESINNISAEEFYYAKLNSVSNLSLINSSSAEFMTNLSSYWATFPYDSFMENSLDGMEKSLTAANYFNRAEKLYQLEQTDLLSKLSTEEPFIFIIINSTDYKKNKKAYTAAGFEEINSTNAAWYNQKIFTDYSDPEQELLDDSWLYKNSNKTADYTKDFYQENISLIQKSTLKNGIQIVSKKNINSSDITILVSIAGGKIKSADDNGFEEVLINLLAGSIQKEILAKQKQGIILGNPLVDYNCEIMTGSITIECSTYDFEACCKSISDAIIYGEILPSQADRAIANRQYKKRLENGSVSFQMMAAIMKDLYSKSDYTKIFEAKKDVLTNTSYQKILESYPELLDASRYSFILTGLVPDDANEVLESTMGLLTSRPNAKIINSVQSKMKNGSTKKSVKVTHTFLTDIPAEKAGPMPSKLIPTTEFLDPVIYVFKIPEPGTKEHTLTLAVLKYLGKLVQVQINSNNNLKEAKPVCGEYYSGTDIITFSIQNVSNQKEADSVFAKAVAELTSLLNSEKQEIVTREIKDTWIESEMQLSLTNSGTAQLLQKGLELFPYEKNTEYYLTEYNFVENADRQDFIDIMNNIPQQAPLRFYAR